MLIYGLLFIVIENVSKNEYGYYSKSSLCRIKKSRSKAVRPGSDVDSSLEMSRIESEKDDVEAGLSGNTSQKLGSTKLNSSDEDKEIMRDGNEVLQIKDIKKSFGSNNVLESVNFNLYKGEMLCLLGANGAGKSTLFNIILDNIE